MTLPNHRILYLFLFSFFENLERLSHPAYIPTHADILHVRQQTQGVQERKISVNSYNYRSVRSENRHEQKHGGFVLKKMFENSIQSHITRQITNLISVILKDNPVMERFSIECSKTKNKKQLSYHSDQSQQTKKIQGTNQNLKQI